MKALKESIMKSLTACMAIALTLTPVTLTSCSSDDDEDSPKEEPSEKYEALGYDEPKYEKESALYLVNASGSDIRSIELTPTGDYIVMKNNSIADEVKRQSPAIRPSALRLNHAIATRAYADDKMAYGRYTRTGDGKYKLDGYGTIVVTGGESNAVKLTITLTDGQKIEVGAMKQAQYTSSQKTNAICRKWNLGKCVLHKPTGDVTYSSIEDMDRHENSGWDESEAEFEPKQVLFTKSGSYIVFFANQTLDVSTWGWTNETTGEARYSWDWDNLYGDESGVILFAFEGKQLLITEPQDAYSYGVTSYCTEAK